MSHALTRWILKIHKWIGICLGLIVFVWLMSGIVMILPLARRPGVRLQPPRYDHATVSPAEAIQRVTARGQDTAAVKRLSVTSVLDRTYYSLELAGGQSYLVDVQTGVPLLITPEVATDIARQTSGVTAAVAGLESVTRHSLGYMNGPLPAFRVDFADGEGSSVFVSPRDGSARYTNRRLRIRFFVSGLHTFDQLTLLEQTDPLKKPLLHLTSMIGIGLVLTGYYLVLPKRWRLKQQ